MYAAVIRGGIIGIFPLRLQRNPLFTGIPYLSVIDKLRRLHHLHDILHGSLTAAQKAEQGGALLMGLINKKVPGQIRRLFMIHRIV